jgi:hypothetical protein
LARGLLDLSCGSGDAAVSPVRGSDSGSETGGASSSFWIRFSDSRRVADAESESSEVHVTENPKPTEPDSNPLIEDPQQTPPHVPELPPLRDPEPQKERTRS